MRVHSAFELSSQKKGKSETLRAIKANRVRVGIPSSETRNTLTLGMNDYDGIALLTNI